MMDTKKFRTRQEVRSMTNPKGKDFIIGLDIGYSGTKVFHEDGCLCFPSYVKHLNRSMLDIPDSRDIFYRDDDTGEEYIVGYNAQEMVESTDTNDTEGELFSRKRYGSKSFKILCNVAIGMATIRKKDNRKIVIWTGLPASYVEGDSPALKKALAVPANFSLKVGKSSWFKFNIDINEKDIVVMSQPMGGLYSAVIRKDGTYTPDAVKILSGNVLVMDIGFGTFDFMGLKNRVTVCTESTDQLGMREVLSIVSKRVLNEYHEDIRVAALQKNLETGTVICVNEEKMSTDERSISKFLEDASKEVLDKAMEKAKSVTNSFRGYQYVIIDGGTGEAWYDDIKNWMNDMKTIRIIPCNINDQLPYIYANARGYYMFGYMNSIRKNK